MSGPFTLGRRTRSTFVALITLVAIALLASPARAEPPGAKLKALVLKPAAKPQLVAGATTAVTAIQRNALIDAVKSAGTPLASRNVLALSGNEVVRLTDANASQILSKPTLTAERFSNAVVETSASGVLTSLGATRAFILPTRFTTLALNANQPVHFDIELAVLNALHYDSVQGKFAAKIALALVNPSNKSDSSALTQEIPVLVQADNADLTPTQVKFTALNTALQVGLTVASPTDPYSIAVMTSLNDKPDKLNIPVARPQIEVLSANPSIWGFGLAQTTLTIRVSEARGRKGEHVALKANSGSISPALVLLDDAGIATAVLRSEGTGSSTIAATDPPFQNGVGAVRFTWPTGFLISTLLGGLSGALLREDIRQKFLSGIAVGLLAAVIVCVAYASGVKFDAWGVPPGGTAEALFFVLGAIGGFLGRKALSKIAG